MNLVQEDAKMAKVQKTFLIAEELATILERIMERSGANFTKIATAALLQYIFDYCDHPEDRGPLICPASEWMGRASRLDRGAVTVPDMPLEILKEAVDYAKYNLKMHEEEGGSKPLAEHWKKTLRAREHALRGWQNAIHDHEGAMKAILDRIEDFYNMGK